ncbi:MAG: glycosyltransferase family 4 protein [Chloroflexi bacterium]|nr:glycosyltransferase family 4 protein [Chloroflexota bacterium]
MRVLQIAPLWETVPPPAYGGTEAVVHCLVEELVRQGHDVTLVASGDSRTSARLVSFYPRSLRTASDLADRKPYALLHAAKALEDARSYDIIHNHVGEEVMALAHLVPEVPMLSTMHCLITPNSRIIWDHYRGYYNTISWAQRRLMPEVCGGTFAGAVYNSVDVATYPFDPDKEDYLLFLARLSPEKGPHLAVEVARRTGRRLVIAGKVDPADFLYFTTVIAPLVDGQQVTFVGEADARMKRELYRKASCLLAPICWEEPFGLVPVEAMACGTPVVAFKRGAVPELVLHGKTGLVVDTLDEMVDAVRRVGEIDPRRCREHVAANFDAPVMADAYLGIYESILAQEFVAPAAGPVAQAVGDGKQPEWTQVA